MSCRHLLVSVKGKVDLFKDCDTKSWRLFLMNKEYQFHCVDLSLEQLQQFHAELTTVLAGDVEYTDDD